MINIVLPLQSKLGETNTHILGEIRKLYDASFNLQCELAV